MMARATKSGEPGDASTARDEAVSSDTTATGPVPSWLDEPHRAAMATGRKDGLAFALGMLAGVFAYAELTPGIDTWIKDTAQGVLTLPTVTGIVAGWWALAFVAFLLFAAWGMGRLEARFRYLRPAGG